MATLDSLHQFSPLSAELPAATYPQLGIRNNHPTLLFDATTDEECYFTIPVFARHYGATGVTVNLIWTAVSATSGSCRWEVAWERVTGQDIDSDSFATAQSAGGTANGTSGILTVTPVVFTNAQIDSVVAGDTCRVLVRRDANGTTGTDDMTGDAELIGVDIRES